MLKRLSPSQKILALAVFCGLFLALALPPGGRAEAPAQIPTGSIPTVTGTPVAALAVVLDNPDGFANLRSGPHAVAYPVVGMLISGQSAPAIGRSPGGDWVQVVYAGAPGGVAWVYKDLVDLRGKVPVVEPPPTATPATTATIDPTLAAQFLVEAPPTRLPTFTPPPDLPTPTLPADAPLANPGRVPMALVIIGLAILGMVGTLVSFLSRG